jgi:hypothetical protein
MPGQVFTGDPSEPAKGAGTDPLPGGLRDRDHTHGNPGI